MYIYIIYFSFAFFFMLLSLLNKEFDFISFSLLIIISLIFIGGRYNVGADFLEYSYIFNYSNNIRFDTGFTWLFELFRILNFSYSEASFSFFLLTIFIFSISIRKYKYKTLSLFFFILYFFIPLTSTIRQGLSLPFYLLAINNLNHPIKYITFSITGALFHISNLIMLPFMLLMKIKISRKKSFFYIIISFIVGYYGIINYFLLFLDHLSFLGGSITKLITYSTKYNDPMSFVSQLYRIRAIIFIFIFWESLQKDTKLNFCKNIYLLTFILTLIFKDNGVLINRLSFSTNISLFYIAINFNSFSGIKIKKMIVLTFFVIYFSVNYFKFIATDLRDNINNAYIPYENFILSNKNE